MKTEPSERGRTLLVIDDTECGRVAVERLVFFGKAGLMADVYLIFAADMKTFPTVRPSHRKEMQVYSDLRLKASRYVEFYKDRLEEVGFNVREVRIIIGNVVEEVLKLEKILNPDVIVLGVEKKGFFGRLFYGDPHRKIISETKSPVMVCKPGYERRDVDYEKVKCIKCVIAEIDNECRRN